jgi:hypothetical protein
MFEEATGSSVDQHKLQIETVKAEILEIKDEIDDHKADIGPESTGCPN